MRNISSWAIKNPIAPILLFFLLTIMGIGAFFKLPINSNPDIEFPAFTVSVGLQGAAPSELENQIATKPSRCAGLPTSPSHTKPHIDVRA
jgi:multidrug efflux pump subunit AcrB